jgi:hypothetical protein
MQALDTHDSPEQLLASLKRRRLAKLVGTIVGLVVALVASILVVALMYSS